MLVVGGGHTGLEEAAEAARSGMARGPGGAGCSGRIEVERPEAMVLSRTTVVGLYDHGVVAAVERVADHLAEPASGEVRQRLWIIRAAEIVLATGAVERLSLSGKRSARA